MNKKIIMTATMAGLFLIACSSQKLEQSNNSNINANVEAEQKVAVSNGTSLEQRLLSQMKLVQNET